MRKSAAMILVITLLLTLLAGCIENKPSENEIPSPSASFTAALTSGTAPLTVQFSDESTGDIDDWLWDFDDDGTVDSTEQNPSYTYEDEGTYTVSLKVIGPGGSDTKTKNDYIIAVENEIQYPAADFTANPASGTVSLVVQFSDESTGDIDDWLWDFDDDGTVDSTARNPSYTYEDEGTYTVSLEVVGPGGSDTKTKNDYITVTLPEEPEATWKLATYTLPGDPITDVYENFARKVDKYSNGRMEIEVHAGDIYTGAESFDGVSTGAVEMAACPPGWYFGKMMNTGAILSTTWSLDPDELLAVRKTLVEEFTPAIEEAGDYDVMHTLWINNDYVEFCFDRDVKVMADVAGLAIGSAGSIINVITNAMGATPVPISLAETYQAAQYGSIDGSVIPVLNYQNLGMYDVLPYLVLTYAFPNAFSTLMNRSAYEALPADLQVVIQKAAAEAEAEGIEEFKRAYDATLDELETAGANIYTLPAAEQQNWWDNAINPVFTGMLTSILGDDLAMAQAIVDNAKAAYQAG